VVIHVKFISVAIFRPKIFVAVQGFRRVVRDVTLLHNTRLAVSTLDVMEQLQPDRLLSLQTERHPQQHHSQGDGECSRSHTRSTNTLGIKCRAEHALEFMATEC